MPEGSIMACPKCAGRGRRWYGQCRECGGSGGVSSADSGTDTLVFGGHGLGRMIVLIHRQTTVPGVSSVEVGKAVVEVVAEAINVLR